MNDPLIGTHVGAYRVERLLGRGGMASIYFAWDTVNNRPVALKVLDERQRGTPISVQRFIHEAQAIATWQHPNIVQVYEAGEDQGVYFYSMEFIRGMDLAQLLRQYLDNNQLLPYAEVLRISWAVSAALDYAHQRGIVHRDVKPSNVLISVDGRVLLSDFGLVMDLTRGTLGETFGSPHYIAPEQARNSAGAVPQSDIYSLGVMLYEMLTGATPFDDPNPTTLALKHLTEMPPAPRALNPRLSTAVESVLMRALMKNPRERYASGRELMSALDRALQGEIGTQADANAPLPLPPETVRFVTNRSQFGTGGNGPGNGRGMPAPAPSPGNIYPQQQPQSGSMSQRPTAYPPAGANRQPTGTRPMAAGSVPPSGGAAPYGAQAGAPAGAPPAGVPQYGYPAGRGGSPPPANPPARRGFNAGCAAATLAMLLLAVVIGAVLALNPANGLFALPGANATNPAPTDPVAVVPTDTPAPEATVTFTPSLTFTGTPPPTETPTLTFTPVPPTLTNTPQPPTATLLPPSPTVAPAAQFAIVHISDRGIVLVNTGESSFPLEPIEIWDNDVELEGIEWDVEQLEPEQCVVVWERDGEVQLPEWLECEQVGEVPERQGRTKFWTRTMNIRLEDQEIAKCRTDQETCEITLP